MNVEVKWKLLHCFQSFIGRMELKLLKKMISDCGEDCSIASNIKLYGRKLHIGNHVIIGDQNLFMCLNAPIHIGDYTMLGPRVSMISGNHRIDVVGKYMFEIGEDEKLPENDQPIVLKGDNWVGANATILQGVTIGEGAVVAAGALVINDVPPYAIVGGVPARVLKYRFDSNTLEKHIAALKNRG